MYTIAAQSADGQRLAFTVSADKVAQTVTAILSADAAAKIAIQPIQ